MTARERLLARKRQLENAPGDLGTAEAWVQASIARVRAERPEMPEEDIAAWLLEELERTQREVGRQKVAARRASR